MAEQVLAVLPLPQLRARLQEERYRQRRGVGVPGWVQQHKDGGVVGPGLYLGMGRD